MKHLWLFASGLVFGGSMMALYGWQVTNAVVAEARFAPMLAIAGTDPVRLQESLQRLERVSDDLSSLQMTAEEQDHIGSLYPVAFLQAVAEAESARRILLYEPHYAHARTYERQLTRAARAGAEDARRFVTALRTYASSTPALYSLAGLITADSLADAAQSLLARQDKLLAESRKRFFCRRNPFCQSPELMTEPLAAAAPRIADTHSTEDFFLAVRQGTSTPRTIRVTLSKSVCVHELAPPYAYLVFPEARLNGRPRAHFLNDIFFMPTRERNGPVLSVLASRIEYAIVRPATFYTCPESQHDAGMFAAITHARSVAIERPDRAEVERRAFLDAPSDATVVPYVRALSRVHPEDIRYGELVLEVAQRSARVDALVEEIADVLEARIAQFYRGIPFDLSARNMFLTHSAFPSLFLMHDTSVITEGIRIASSSPSHLGAFMEAHATYERVLGEVGFERLVRDAKTLRDFDTE